MYRGGHLELAADPGLLVPMLEEFLDDDPAAVSGPVPEEENTT